MAETTPKADPDLSDARDPPLSEPKELDSSPVHTATSGIKNAGGGVEGLPQPVAELLRAVEESDEHLALFRKVFYERHPHKLEAPISQPRTHSLWLRCVALCVALHVSFYIHSQREDRQSTYVCAVVDYATADLEYDLFGTPDDWYGHPLNTAGELHEWGCGSPRSTLFSKNQAIAHCQANLRGLHDYMAEQLAVGAKKLGKCEVGGVQVMLRSPAIPFVGLSTLDPPPPPYLTLLSLFLGKG